MKSETAGWSLKANKRWLVFWKIMLCIAMAYLIFAIIPPTVIKGIIIGSICTVMALFYIWLIKRQLRKDALSQGYWKCWNCGEQNHNDFVDCWKCHKPKRKPSFVK